jgi:hypothetical protein
MRDMAIEGLSTLAQRGQWRASVYRDRITTRVLAALDDVNPLVRMHAAEAFRALHEDSTSIERVGLLNQLLDRETHPNVRAQLLLALGREAHDSPSGVDAVLGHLLTTPVPNVEPPPETLTVEGPDNAGDVEDTLDAAADGTHSQLLVSIVALLALTYKTPLASAALDRWAAGAPSSPELQHAIPLIRDYLAVGSDSAQQARAFAFVRAAADSAVAWWSDLKQKVAVGNELSDAERNEFENALHVLDSIATGLYFASGAYEDERNDGTDAEPADKPLARADLARFADLAIPVLLTCAESNAAPVIHQVVETLVFLAPLDEKGGLIALTRAATAGEGYAYDSLAGSVIVPYLQRLLAEQRQLVLFDAAGVVAFRRLLSAFASSGNEAALVLAFTFADVFR